MKHSHKRRVLVLAAALLTAFAAESRPVDATQARRVAEAFMATAGANDRGKATLVEDGFDGLYVFNFERGGFVIVAADDCAKPVLGYSATGSFRVDNMPANVRGWLEDYDRSVAQLRGEVGSEAGSGSDEVAAEWASLAHGEGLRPLTLTAVAPMLTTTWNQSPLYNDQCPYDSAYGERVVTGCVATATAQIMKYWNHPATGYGSHSYTAQNDHANYGVLTADFGNTNYAWTSMPNALTSVSSQAEIDAVAQLMYHVGVAIEMGYNVGAQGGSYAYNHSDYNPSTMSALRDYFKYSPDMAVVYRNGMDDAVWCATLRGELDQQRPILYDGRDNSGHSFVCDGYDQRGYFHFNWGWGGYCDGYYAMGALNPTPGGTGGNATGRYNGNNTAVLGIKPLASFGNGGTVTVTATGGDTTCSVAGGGTYSFGDMVTLNATAGAGYRFEGWGDGSMANPRTFTMTGGDYTLTARFEPLGTDTMSYCGNRGMTSYWGEFEQGFEKYWGIKLPASTLTAGQSLRAVEFYVGADYYDGNVEMTVYSGTDTPTDVVYTTSTYLGYSDRDSWLPLFLPTAWTVEAGKSLWITFRCTDILFPATITSSSGNPDGFLYGSAFQPDPEWTRFSYMIRARFDAPAMAADGDTISYCGDRANAGTATADEWGILLPAAELQGRNYLKSVKVYADESGVCELHVYRGGSEAPATLVHTQPSRVLDWGWHEVVLDSTIAIAPGDSLWITFTSPIDNYYLAMPLCRYAGNDNSNWMRMGQQWMHVGPDYYWQDYSLMIKAVTSVTMPEVPRPTVVLLGERYAKVGEPTTFTAMYSNSATVSWNVTGGATVTYNGDAVDVEWPQTGWYRIEATATNSHGDSTTYKWVEVVDCGDAVTSYPYVNYFNADDNMLCFDTVDADGDGNGWELGDGRAYSRSYGWSSEGMDTLAPDNWLLLPKMATMAEASYSLGWSVYPQPYSWDDEISLHYGVYIDTTCGSAPQNYILVGEYTETVPEPVNHTVDLSAYAGKSFRLAFRHYNNHSATSFTLTSVRVDERVPIYREGDTISYCGGHSISGNLGYTGGVTHWGVKFEPEHLVNYSALSAVMVCTYYAGDYTLKMWQGGEDAPGNLVYSKDTSFEAGTAWREIELPQLAVDNAQPLWITFTSTAMYPALFATFCGELNSNYISGDGQAWAHATDYGYEGSWMIKAVLSGESEVDCDSYVLPYRADFTRCWTAEGGAYAVDASRASLNGPGQRLVGPWFEAPEGTCYVRTRYIRDYENYWYSEDSVVTINVTVETESTGEVEAEWVGEELGGNEELRVSRFYSSGGRYRLVIEYSSEQPVQMLHIADLAVFSYPMTLDVEAPESVYVGDTLTMTATAIMPDEAELISCGWGGSIYRDSVFVPTDDPSISILSEENGEMKIVCHTAGRYYFYAWLTVYSAEWDCSPDMFRKVAVNVIERGPNGCDGVEQGPEARVYAADGHIVVEQQTDDEVTVYDMAGRRVTSRASAVGGRVTVAVPASGVYMVRIGERAARRLVVVK